MAAVMGRLGFYVVLACVVSAGFLYAGFGRDRELVLYPGVPWVPGSDPDDGGGAVWPVQVSWDGYKEQLEPVDWYNSSALFGTVNNALRRKGSDLNPVGVSFIPAVIPANTLLYHGTLHGKFPDNPEWIAMDPEFSYNFKNGLWRWRGKKLPAKKPDHDQDSEVDQNARGQNVRGQVVAESEHEQVSFDEQSLEDGFESDMEGDLGVTDQSQDASSLLTFITKKPLDKLILLDGASGAKSSFGEMDTQMLWSQMERSRWTRMQIRDERIMAKKICEWGRPYGLDGIIRLEISFEVIICDFHSPKIDLLSNVTYPNPYEFLGLPADHDSDYYSLLDEFTDSPSQALIRLLSQSAGYDHIKSGESHYNGDYRIELDYRHMITAINRTYLTPDTYLRRLDNITQEVQDGMIEDIAYALQHPIEPRLGNNWQLLTDTIVARLAPLLYTLNTTLAGHTGSSQSQSIDDLRALGVNLTTGTYNILRMYSDNTTGGANITDDALDSFVFQYSKPTYPLYSETDRLIWSAIYQVVRAIGHQLFSIFSLSKDIISTTYQNHELNQQLITELSRKIDVQSAELNRLLTDLNWSYYYQCSHKCREDELCMVPTWGPTPYHRWKTIDEHGQRRRVSYSDLQCIGLYDLVE
ncbi:hypothetical protein AWJ20_1479 [Sugiyamaella lignohabitans]|uniref:Uncharacterized protein n=1 Tax=Sugiyamaella lignohabitans TaxID=796027 RepID=A0A161HK11_9ASCO|nr:uncharacterized protein AWJ20_1479 [Sugiyamaella lignohabitans]ANB13197.1 hypothetical protein AWJ20_1479 [Sugiyamaella lignohabitans]